MAKKKTATKKVAKKKAPAKKAGKSKGTNKKATKKKATKKVAKKKTPTKPAPVKRPRKKVEPIVNLEPTNVVNTEAVKETIPNVLSPNQKLHLKLLRRK